MDYESSEIYANTAYIIDANGNTQAHGGFHSTETNNIYNSNPPPTTKQQTQNNPIEQTIATHYISNKSNPQIYETGCIITINNPPTIKAEITLDHSNKVSVLRMINSIFNSNAGKCINRWKVDSFHCYLSLTINKICHDLTISEIGVDKNDVKLLKIKRVDIHR